MTDLPKPIRISRAVFREKPQHVLALAETHCSGVVIYDDETGKDRVFIWVPGWSEPSHPED